MRWTCVSRTSLIWVLLAVAATAQEDRYNRVPTMHQSSSHVPAWRGPAAKKRVCYFVLPPTLDPGPAMAHLCTHLLCGFAAVRDGALVPERPEDTIQYRRLVALKTTNPSLKVMLSLGALGSRGVFSAVIASSDGRKKFIASAIAVLREYGFDGIDFDWEFPGQGAPPEEDRKNFDVFLKEVRESFKNESDATHRNELLLSVAVAATAELIQQGYDATAISRYADFINLMTYDYHMYKPYLPFTGHNSPLFKRKVEEGIFSTLHVVCEFLNDGATSVFDDESQVPYAYKNLTWVGYDNVASIRSKVVWVVARGFGGVMTFALNDDDAENVCGHGPFPIHAMIRNMLSS